MKFSVVIPLYNKAPYVAKAIESVLAQTYTDYELVIMDDGSKDDSFEIARKTIEGHGHCHLYRQKNAGVSMARNNGVALSQGKYLCFLDADDWWEPAFLEEMSELIDAFPEAGIYGTNYTIVNETRHKTRVASVGVDEGFIKGYINYCQVYAKTLYMPLWTGAVCIPRQVFDAVGGFNPQLRMSEDFDLWIRIVLHHKVAFLNKPLSNYNQDVYAAPRALGSLPQPQTQFAFCADYLKEDMARDAALKYVVEFVQISCLRDYYLSKAYHSEAKKVLDGIDLKPHMGGYYAEYLKHPLWRSRLLVAFAQFIVRKRYGK